MARLDRAMTRMNERAAVLIARARELMPHSLDPDEHRTNTTT
jgi:hypothetical protein